MKNYFSVFDLPPSFDLDTSALEKLYFNAQRTFHPDRLIGKGPAERQQAILQSMLINEAYAALGSPLERARHLLALQGITVGSEKDSVKPSSALLMETMEVREALSEATTIEAITKMGVQNTAHKEDSLAKLSAAFTAGDLQAAAQLAIRLGYQMKLDEEIRVRKKGLAA